MAKDEKCQQSDDCQARNRDGDYPRPKKRGAHGVTGFNAIKVKQFPAKIQTFFSPGNNVLQLNDIMKIRQKHTDFLRVAGTLPSRERPYKINVL
jgi:hypothetical protein